MINSTTPIYHFKSYRIKVQSKINSATSRTLTKKNKKSRQNPQVDAKEKENRLEKRRKGIEKSGKVKIGDIESSYESGEEKKEGV